MIIANRGGDLTGWSCSILISVLCTSSLTIVRLNGIVILEDANPAIYMPAFHREDYSRHLLIYRHSFRQKLVILERY